MLRTALLLLAAAAIAGGCMGSDDEATEGTAARVTELTNVLQLRAAFNDAQGQPRLILLLSPT